MGIVLKGGLIVTAVDIYKADIRIEGEKIVAIGSQLQKTGDEVISIDGYYILPGGIDTHTHFDLETGTGIRTADDFASGTKAAIAGGTTTILDYATQNKGESLQQGLNNWNQKAKNKSYCDVGFHMAITDWNDKVPVQMKDMIQKGISSFKIYMAYKGIMQMDDEDIFKALIRSRELGALITFHCENGDVIEALIQESKSKKNTSPYYHPLVRPALVEKEAVTRLLYLAELANAPVYIVHLSSKEALENVIEAKKRGVEVHVETCPHYLLLEDSLYDLEGFESAKYVMSPPLRKQEDIEALWNGINNHFIDTISTDHCSFNFRGHKDVGINDFSQIPNGIPGVEHRISLLYTYGVQLGKISLNKLVELTSTNAAKLFGVYPQKGTIAVGSDADIVVWDFNQTSIIEQKTQIQNVDYTPYEGMQVKAQPVYVFLRGNKVLSQDGGILEQPQGRFVKRKSLKGE